MLINFFKFFSIFLCTINMNIRIINIKLRKNYFLSISILSILLSCIALFFNSILTELTYVIPLIILWICIGLYNSTPKLSFITAIISFCISYGLFSIASGFCILIMTPLYYNRPNFPYIILSITVFLVHNLWGESLLNLKRFKKGMPFLLNSTNFVNNATIICLLLISFLINKPFKNATWKYQVFFPIAIIFFTISLIHWWQAQITKSYKQRLVMRELDSLRVEVEEKDKEISRLKAQNEELGRLIHHDNKRIPAMENAVCEYLVSDFNDINAAKERANALRLEIESLSRNRSNTLKEIYAQKSHHYNTGICELDTLLNYMAKRAADDKIELNVHNTVNLTDYIPKCISIDDLTHMLSDLLENALIATNLADTKAIQLQFYVSGKDFIVEVADSGIPFEAKSIANFGLSRLTTHEDTGGSGIGLMDIRKIKETYGVTLHIEEYEMPTPFTKKISLVFNHKNIYSVRTFRVEEISTLSKRNDLKLYNFND